MRTPSDSTGRTKKIARWVTLIAPFLSPWVIEVVAAMKYDWIYYGSYDALIRLAFVISGLVAFFLFKKPGKIGGAGLAIFVIYLTISLLLPMSQCEEYLVLKNEVTAQKKSNECDVALLHE